MSDKKEVLCCCCILVTLTILIMIITTSVHKPPKVFLHSIYIPSLDMGANSSKDTTLTFKIYFKNPNPALRLEYNPINVTFYDFRPQQAIANFIIPHFYHERSALKGGTINTTRFDREAAMHDISKYGYWTLRVDLVTSGTYKLLWRSRTKHFRFGAIVQIGDTGIKVEHKKRARLTSGATNIGSSIFERMFFILINLFVACFLCSY